MVSSKRGSSFDRVLVFCTLCLLCLSMVLIYSASIMEVGTSDVQDGAYYLKRQIVYVAVSLAAAFICSCINSKVWMEQSSKIFILALILLFLVLVIGREVNEARRWISLGPINIQPAEVMKLSWIIYLSSYCFRHADEVRKTRKGFLKPLLLMLVFLLLLYLQPDFGSCVVIVSISLGILFMAGSAVFPFIGVISVFGLAGGLMIVFEPYRLARVTSFLDPWSAQFGSGYQLTQSLMAFGRGGLTGEGLGNSYQKLGYLPEAHTDFVTAIFGEEFGFVGMMILLLLEFIIIAKALCLSIKILRRAPCFQGYLAFAIGLWFALQTFINVGAASGMLPTKGLTLPLISYGGSSLLMCMAAVGMLLRIDFEWRNHILSF